MPLLPPASGAGGPLSRAHGFDVPLDELVSGRSVLGYQGRARAEASAPQAEHNVFAEVAHASRAALRTETPPAARPKWVDRIIRAPSPPRQALAGAGGGYGTLDGGEDDDHWDRGLLGRAAHAPGSPVARPKRAAAAPAPDGGAEEAGRLLALPGGELRGTHADEVLARVYEYFFEGGFAVAVASRVLSAAVLFFTIAFSAFVVAGVRWRELAECRQGAPGDCVDLGRFASWSFLVSPAGWQNLVVAYVAAMGAYWAWSVAVLPSSVARFWGTGRFYRRVLGVTDAELPAAPWEHVASRLEDAVKQGRLPLRLGNRWGLGSGAAAAEPGAADSGAASPHAEAEVTVPGRADARIDGLARLPSATGLDAGERPASSDRIGPGGGAPVPGVGLVGSHEVACRITRRDDFLVALAADGELDVDADVSCPVTPTACRRWAWSSRVFRHSWRFAVRCCARACDAVPEDVDVSGPSPAELRKQGVPDDEAADRRAGAPSSSVSDSDSDSGLDGEGGGHAPRRRRAAPDPGESSRRAFRLRRGWLTVHLSLPLTHVTASYARFALINPLFGPDMRARRAFLRRPRSLRWCLRGLGLLHLVALPFSLTFAAVFWVISLAEEARSSSNYLGARVWSPQARWLFREYSELPHALDRRCASAVPKAHAYLRQFPSPLLALAGRAVAFVAGALLLALLASTLLVDEDLLTDMHLGGRNLLWYVALLSGAVAAGRSLIPAPEDTAVSPAAAMADLAALTHHFPASWRGREHTPRVRGAVEALFPNRAVVVLRELAALLLAPVLLCVVLPRRAERILRRLDGLLVSVPGLGDVCKHSLLGHIDTDRRPAQGAALDVRPGRKPQAGRDDAAHPTPGADAPAPPSPPSPPPSPASSSSGHSLRSRASAAGPGAPRAARPARRPQSPPAPLRPSDRKAGRAVASFHCQNPAWSASVHGAPGLAPPAPMDGSAAMESSAVEALVFSHLLTADRADLLRSVHAGAAPADAWIRPEAIPAEHPAAPRPAAPAPGWGSTAAAAEHLAARSRLAIMAALARVLPVLGDEEGRRIAQRARDETAADAQRGGGMADPPAAGGVGVGPMLRQFQRL